MSMYTDIGKCLFGNVSILKIAINLFISNDYLIWVKNHSRIHWLSNRGCLFQDVVDCKTMTRICIKDRKKIERKSCSKRQRHVFCHDGLDYGSSCLNFWSSWFLFFHQEDSWFIAKPGRTAWQEAVLGTEAASPKSWRSPSEGAVAETKRFENERFNNDASWGRHQI